MKVFRMEMIFLRVQSKTHEFKGHASKQKNAMERNVNAPVSVVQLYTIHYCTFNETVRSSELLHKYAAIEAK